MRIQRLHGQDGFMRLVRLIGQDGRYSGIHV